MTYLEDLGKLSHYKLSLFCNMIHKTYKNHLYHGMSCAQVMVQVALEDPTGVTAFSPQQKKASSNMQCKIVHEER